MNERPRWLVGLQAYAYDVIDEGPEAIVDAAEMCGADVLLVAVSYLDHIAPTEVGRGVPLQRNTRRRQHGQEAYIRPTPTRYPKELLPPTSIDEGADGERAYLALRAAAEPRGIQVVPWILALTQPVAMQAPAFGVVNVRGDVVPGWLCPSRPATRSFVRGLVEDVVDRLNPPAVFLDGVRFPGPGPHGLVDLFGCFCESCQESAKAQGLRLSVARETLRSIADLVENEAPTAARLGAEVLASGLAEMRALARHPELLEWAEFRHRAVEHVVADVRDHLRGKAELWLDAWPASSGWLLGQDLARLAPYGTWTKTFTYHRWGGGADMPGMIGSISSDRAVRQQLYDVYRSFFGLGGPPDFDQFVSRGVDPGWITTETALAGTLLDGRSKLAAGLQLWQMGAQGVRDALDYAVEASPDGVIFHCYGWATHDELRAAGTWLRERGLAGQRSS